MKLSVKNNLGQEFTHTCAEFVGIDVFMDALENWGYDDWHTYDVCDGEEVLESVLNPNYLKPVEIH